jgi:hypothetical protein
MLPIVLLFLSNAKAHEIEARLHRALKSEDEVLKRKETEAAFLLVLRSTIAIQYISKHGLQIEKGNQ